MEGFLCLKFNYNPKNANFPVTCSHIYCIVPLAPTHISTDKNYAYIVQI
jgi:hypothetical protein